MDAQEHRDRDVGRDDPSQEYRGLPIRLRLLVAALHFVVLFVVLLAAYFALDYFGFTGDQRGDVVGSLADAAAQSALLSAGYVVLLPLLAVAAAALGAWRRAATALIGAARGRWRASPSRMVAFLIDATEARAFG